MGYIIHHTVTRWQQLVLTLIAVFLGQF
jgi:hypothetical protein